MEDHEGISELDTVPAIDGNIPKPWRIHVCSSITE